MIYVYDDNMHFCCDKIYINPIYGSHWTNRNRKIRSIHGNRCRHGCRSTQRMAQPRRILTFNGALKKTGQKVAVQIIVDQLYINPWQISHKYIVIVRFFLWQLFLVVKCHPISLYWFWHFLTLSLYHQMNMHYYFFQNRSDSQYC